MNEKFDNLVCEPLSQQEIQETHGGLFLLLAQTALLWGTIGLGIYGAYKMGYDKACGCDD